MTRPWHTEQDLPSRACPSLTCETMRHKNGFKPPGLCSSHTAGTRLGLGLWILGVGSCGKQSTPAPRPHRSASQGLGGVVRPQSGHRGVE